MLVEEAQGQKRKYGTLLSTDMMGETHRADGENGDHYIR